MSIDQHTLPLFPLNTVLFPNSSLPLQIFEDRYMQMLRTCLDNDSKFGVVLIREGPEVGGQATHYDIGTVAEIEKPYINADVLLLNEESDIREGSGLINEVRQAASSHISLIEGLQGGWVNNFMAPLDPVSLSYFIASALQIDQLSKQELLEEKLVSKRLETELEILTRASLPIKQVVKRRLAQKFSRN
jgi:ATP-dependent Lon protease